MNSSSSARRSIQPHKMSKYKFCVWVCVLPLLVSSLAWADPLPVNPTLDIKLWIGSTMREWTPQILDAAGGGYKVDDISYSPPGASLFCYNMTLNYDPFISASADILNNTASIQHYTLLFSIPISPAITPASVMGGSVQGGLTDANNDGIGTISTFGPGTDLFNGQIDGVDQLPLFSDVKTINVPFQGGSASDSTSAGLPGPSLPGPSALSTIGIKFEFTLTPGDRATFTGFFSVGQTIPEPGSLSLLGLGGLLLFRRRFPQAKPSQTR